MGQQWHGCPVLSACVDQDRREAPRRFPAVMTSLIVTGCSRQGNDHYESNPRFPSDSPVIPQPGS
jgi:hypothetical protein